MARLGIIATIAAVLLAVAPTLADPVVAVKLAVLAAGLSLTWLGMWGRPLRRTAIDAPIAALWLAMAASTLTSVDPPASVLGMYPQVFYGLLPLALCTALYYAVAMLPEPPTDTVMTAALASAIPLCLYGLSQRFFGDLITHLPLPNGERITSSIGSPVMLGACLVLLVPPALDRILSKKDFFGWSAGLLIATALALTLARGAWLSAATASLFYFWLTGRLRMGKKALIVLAVGALLALAGVQRVLHRGDSDAMRVETAKTALAAFAERPWLGCGPDTFLIAFRRHKTDEFLRRSHNAPTIQSSAHNDILQAAATLGVFGLLAYLWLLVAVAGEFRERLRAPAGDGTVAAMAAGLTGLFIQAKLNPIPISALALAAALLGLVARKRQALAPRTARAAASLVFCFCAACAVVFTRACLADHLYRRGQRIVNTQKLTDPTFMGGVDDLKRATELAPWVLDYLSQRCDTIWRVIPQVPPAQARQLAEKTRELTAAAVRRHPGNPMVHELRATALAVSARLGEDTLKEALREIKIASELDPTFVFSLRRRIEIARAAGDLEEFEAARAQYLRVIQLTGDSPGWQPLM